MKASNINFAHGVTIYELNSYNCALKNDYINNLISMAFKILPLYNTIVGGIEITQGFISEAMAKDTDFIKSERDRNFCKGLAIEFTWAGYTVDSAITLTKQYMSQIKGSCDLVITDRALQIHFAKKDKTLYQRIKNSNNEIEYRMIVKE